MTRSHLALAAERGELVPLPAFLERAWQIMRETPAEPDEETRPALFLLEGGGQTNSSTPRADLQIVASHRTYARA
jgi:hypothetical protein